MGNLELIEGDFYDPADDYGGGSVRLWMSEQQWVSLLDRVSRGRGAWRGPERREARGRLSMQMRCMLRVGGDGSGGIFNIHSRNVSSGGLGFLHGGFIDPGTRCTVAMVSPFDHGVIASGRIAWCRPIEMDVYDAGVEFDKPIDLEPFLPDAA